MSLETVLRGTLALVQSERDDAITYLSTLRSILETLGRMPGLRSCAQEVASILLRDLKVESCAILMRADEKQRPSLLGFATQAQQLGAPEDPHDVHTWILLAERVDPDNPLAWLRPSAQGGFEPIEPGGFSGESFQLTPFSVGDELGGAIVLHRLVAPAQSFAHAAAMPLIASAVGEALTIAQAREAAALLSETLETELGLARSSLSARELTLRERERRIARLTEAVVESNRVKRDFLAVISHELRTPLNAIVGFATLLLDDLGESASDEQTGMMRGILGGARRLTSLVEDVLLYVELEGGGWKGSEAEVDLLSIIDETVAAVDPDRGAPIELRVEVDRRAVRARLDAVLIRRVLFHLLGNAFKFTRQGHVMVAARPGRDSNAIELEVHDTGQGMPPERVDEMFQLFTQGDGSSRRPHDGLGLGLTLVQRAVRTLGGKVDVQSRPGQGSTFRVVLPNAFGRKQASGAAARA